MELLYKINLVRRKKTMVRPSLVVTGLGPVSDVEGIPKRTEVRTSGC